MASPKLTESEQRQLRGLIGDTPRYTLRERDLGGISLAGVKATGATFFKVSFAEADFSGAQFQETTFEECDFTSSQFKNAVFEKVAFKRCALALVTADKCVFRRTSLEACSVDGLESSDGILESVAWKSVTGERLLLRDCTINQSTWTECKLVRPKFVCCTLNDDLFEQTTFSNFMFMQGQWRGLKVNGGGFDDGAFDRVFLAAASFVKATFKSTQFFGGMQTNVKFANCPLVASVTFDSSKVCNLTLDECAMVHSLVILHGTVEGFVVRKCALAYFDVSESQMDSTSFSNLEMHGLTFLNSAMDAMTMEGIILSGILRVMGSRFKGLRLVKFQYAANYEKLGEAAEYIESDRFR